MISKIVNDTQKITKSTSHRTYGTYMVEVNGTNDIVIVKAFNVVDASRKVEKQGYTKLTGHVTQLTWADKYVCASDIPDTLLAEHGIQPRCHKCDCLININKVHTKHGRAYCPKCLAIAK